MASESRKKKTKKERKSTTSKKTSSSKKKRNDNDDDADIVENDDRFVCAITRPQFRPAKKVDTKVVLDERFQAVLTDERFQVYGCGKSSSSSKKDKYGRRQKRVGTAESELQEFYTIVKKEEDEDSDGKKGASEKEAKLHDKSNGREEVESSDDEDSENDDDDDPASRIAYLTALSRGEVELSSSSEDENSTDDDEDHDSSDSDNDSDSSEDSVYGRAGVLDPSTKEAPPDMTHVPSPFLAVTNMDWTHVRAVDLLAILSSFTAPGAVRKVQILQSDFGKERLEKETVEGPSGLWKRKKNKIMQNENSLDDVGGGDDGEDEDEDDEDGNKTKVHGITIHEGQAAVESDFDPEKLRAYEASKLKYYFAVVEFASPAQADIAYKEVDGMELERSSAAMDLRSIDPDALVDVLKDRKVRDEATAPLPHRYEPPDFVVNALQQTSVKCTWEEGDVERQLKLTRYGQAEWNELAEGDDLRAYLASDNSSEEDEDDHDNSKDEDGEKKSKKGTNMRKLLGLDNGEDEEDPFGDIGGMESDGGEEEEDDEDDDGVDMTITFVPGKKKMADKIREKLESKGEPKEMTPWQKYQEKRKEQRRERRRAARGRRHPQDDEPDELEDEPDDDFFAEETTGETKRKKNKNKQKTFKSKKDADEGHAASSKEELELLVAGDDTEEIEKDYDMRDLMKLEKNSKKKKLKGKRKRKQDALVRDTAGQGFTVNTSDRRFRAVLDGADDRFGIDRTDANFKDTPAMRHILKHQSKKRRAARVSKDTSAADAGVKIGGTGAAALTSLVKSIKAKVSKGK